jgi:hypothetical protein
MGTWRVTVEGHGIHDYGRDEDANAMATQFVLDLRAAGHDHVNGKFELTDDQGQVVGGQSLAPEGE